MPHTCNMPGLIPIIRWLSFFLLSNKGENVDTQTHTNTGPLFTANKVILRCGDTPFVFCVKQTPRTWLKKNYLCPGSWVPPRHASWHWQIHWHPPCCQSWGRRPVGHRATGGRSAWLGCTWGPWEWHSLSPPGEVHDEQAGKGKRLNKL